MAIKGSTLEQTLCTFWGSDYGAAADKKGKVEAMVRLSMLGNVMAKDPDEFAELFSGQTQSGLADRMVLVPGPPRWNIEDGWQAPTDAEDTVIDGETFPSWTPSPAPISVKLTAENFAQLKEWTLAHRTAGRQIGRTGEIAKRVALISSSANGEKLVSRECMAAALAFADWQMEVRRVYVAGESLTDDAKVTNMLLNAFLEMEASLAAGKPKKVAGKPVIASNGWTNFRQLSRLKSFGKKHAASIINRNLQAAVSIGWIERRVEGREPTNEYRTAL
jgi:hypothetical protein